MKDDFLVFVFDRVPKRFGALTAVNDAALAVKRGESFSRLGSSVVRDMVEVQEG